MSLTPLPSPAALTPTPRRPPEVELRSRLRNAWAPSLGGLISAVTLLLGTAVPMSATAGKGYTPSRPSPTVSARPASSTPPWLSTAKVKPALPATPGVSVSRKGSILSGGRVYPNARVGEATSASRNGKGLIFKPLPGGKISEMVKQWRFGPSTFPGNKGATVIHPEGKGGNAVHPLPEMGGRTMSRANPYRHIELTRRDAMEDVFGKSRPATVRDQFEHAHDHGLVVNSARNNPLDE